MRAGIAPPDGTKVVRRAPAYWRSVGVIVLLFGAIGATPERAIALDDTYLICEGSIATYLVNGQAPPTNEHVTVHIESDKVNISGTSISDINMQICTQTSDKLDFYSKSCSGVSDPYARRTYGTFNKITGNLVVTVTPSSRSIEMLQGKFVCRKTEPVMK